jgi:hypothetical protein
VPSVRRRKILFINEICLNYILIEEENSGEKPKHEK